MSPEPGEHLVFAIVLSVVCFCFCMGGFVRLEARFSMPTSGSSAAFPRVI